MGIKKIYTKKKHRVDNNELKKLRTIISKKIITKLYKKKIKELRKRDPFIYK